MSKRQYSPGEREQACLRARELSLTAAGKELGIPAGKVVGDRSPPSILSPMVNFVTGFAVRL